MLTESRRGTVRNVLFCCLLSIVLCFLISNLARYVRNSFLKILGEDRRLNIAAVAPGLTFATYPEIEDAYYSRVAGIHVKCENTTNVGRMGDGGWRVCMDSAFVPRKPCVVYSFGVGNIWEFDEALARDYGCVVRAFDPSMSQPDHVHYPGPVNFYAIGLGGSNRTLSNGWQLFTFESILQRFGDFNRILDLVKIDIEYSEWEALEAILKTDVLKRTKQLVFEVHTNEVSGALTSKGEFLRYHLILDALEAAGFRRFYQHDNLFGVRPMESQRMKAQDPIYHKSRDLNRTCCHELHYINMHYAKDLSGMLL